MAFTVERGALHRPLGFRAETIAGASDPASGGTIAGTIAGRIAVERWAADQQGATAALLAPPDAQADDGVRALRRALAEGLGELLGVRVTADATHPLATARDGARDASTDAGFTRLATALAEGGLPTVLAGTRGIVDGELVSLLGMASGRLRPTGRSPVRWIVLTDARLDRATLEPLLRESAEQALVSIAGLATPLRSDSVIALANGLAQSARIEAGSLGFETLRVGMTALLQELMRALLEQAWSPAAACLVQVSVVGAADSGEAAREAEALAASDELARVVSEVLARPDGGAQRVGRFAVRRTKDGQQLAVAVELGRGRLGATRWIALPR